jgi:hypothetical protein
MGKYESSEYQYLVDEDRQFAQSIPAEEDEFLLWCGGLASYLKFAEQRAHARGSIKASEAAKEYPKLPQTPQEFSSKIIMPGIEAKQLGKSMVLTEMRKFS